MAPTEDLIVEVKEDGVLIRFAARNGTEAVVDVADLAARFDGAIRETLLAWCRDRTSAAPPQSLAEQTNPLLVQDYAD
jgi:hypothetical protein